MSLGTVMSSVISPFASAAKKYVWTTLQSWTSPAWLAGRCVAVTLTTPPGRVMPGSTASVTAWLLTTAQTPMIKSRIRTAASAITWRRRERRAGAAGGGGDGYATATVSGSNRTVSAGGGGTAPRLVSRRVDATGGAITIVLASTSAGGALSADSSASTNSVAEAHLEAGSLASPFISTASTSVPRDATRALGGVGRRWTCA